MPLTDTELHNKHSAKRAEYSKLKKKFSNLEHSVDHEMKTAKAIEMGLLMKLDGVEVEHKACVYSMSAAS